MREPIAIIGMAGRFPKAASVSEYWRNLREGRDCITFFSEEELDRRGVDRELRRRSEYVGAAGVLEGADLFDAAFFGIPPREAEIADPQHRLFLEQAWHALENAAIDPRRARGAIGVFAACGMDTYFMTQLAMRAEIWEAFGFDQLRALNRLDNLATRTAYALDLRGPTMTVQTGCSSALVAVHLAIDSLLAGECDVALAGAVRVSTGRGGYLYREHGVLSPDGRCRAYDAAAAGTITGDGVGIVVLRRLSDALAAGDPIDALVLGSAVNNDGNAKVGYTAPSIEGQANVIAEALAVAGVRAEEIDHVEGHGTGTPLGDPIEVAALTRAFRETTSAKQYCALASVKANIGHLDTAAGIAGLIKVVCELQHRELAPSIHFEHPNPAIDFASSPFFVNRALVPWPNRGRPRRAGVSSFGIGGTNVHLVVQEAPERAHRARAQSIAVWCVSAKTAPALDAASAELEIALQAASDAHSDELAATLQLGRTAFEHRRAVAAASAREAAAAFTSNDPRRVFSAGPIRSARGVAFLFPGQGAQRPGMMRELYVRQPVFKRVLDRCFATYLELFGEDLVELVFPRDPADRRLDDTRWAQPAIFAVELALAELWKSWGVRAVAMIGHSIGEYTAACVAGALSPEHALRLVGLRGRMMSELPRGAMLAIALDAQALAGELGSELSIAAINGPSSTVVSGPEERLAELAERIESRGVAATRLRTSHAFHSRMMDGIFGRLAPLARELPLGSIEVPFVSNVTGTWIGATELADGTYWDRHARGTVLFAKGLGELLRRPDWILLEVGPGSTLSQLAGTDPRRSPEQAVISSLGRSGEVMEALARLWTLGATIDWSAVHGEAPPRVHLPGYPFERRRYWIDAPAQGETTRPKETAVLESDVGRWFSAPIWRSTPPSEAAARDPGPTLIFRDAFGIGDVLAGKLAGEGLITVLVEPGAWQRSGAHFRIDPLDEADYRRLLATLRSEGRAPATIVHLWTLTDSEDPRPDAAAFARLRQVCFDELLILARAIAEELAGEPVRLLVATNRLYDVSGEDPTIAEKSLLEGPSRVLPHEQPAVSCTVADLELSPTRAALHLARELRRSKAELAIAFRGPRRWRRELERLVLPAPKTVPVRAGGNYLITGGLGGIGLALAEALARAGAAGLVLTGRSPIPPRAAWESGGVDERSARRFARVIALERTGVRVLTAQAPVADASRMRELLAAARRELGPIAGVIHAAGVPSGGVMQRRTPAELAAVLEPKVEGTRVLEELLAGEPVDFVAFCSSLTAVRGAFGQVDYCAANVFLDALANGRRFGSAKQVISLNWSSWRDTGMAAEAEIPADLAARRKELARFGIDAERGAEAFLRAIDSGMPQLVVCPYDVAQEHLVRGAPPPAAGAVPAVHRRPELRTPFVAAKTPMEQRIAAIWRDLFGIEQIGADDDFFELGGHSLLAAQLISRVRAEVGARVGLSRLFERPTIGALAAEIERDQRTENDAVIPRCLEHPAPLSFAQRRLWLLNQLEPSDFAYNIAKAMRLKGVLDRAALIRALEEIVRRHEPLRTAIELEGATPVQRIADPPRSIADFVDLAALAPPGREEELRRILATEASRPFELASGRLIRWLLVRLGEGEHVLEFVVHHAACDGWSIGIIASELATLYNAYSAGAASPLPELPIRYRDFAAWQRARLHGEQVEKLLAYWTKQLRDLPPDVELGRRELDRRGPPRGAIRQRPIAPQLAKLLSQVAREEGATLFMTTVTAFFALLHRWTGAEDLRVAVPVSGRPHPATEPLVGVLINLLVLRADLSGPPTLRGLLARVRSAAAEAFDHQELPFEKIVEALAPERRGTQTPLVTIGFALQNAPRSQVPMAGLELSAIEVEVRAPTFDLTVSVLERGESLVLVADYATDVFDAALADTLLEHYECFLRAIAEDLDRRIADVALLSPAARAGLLRPHDAPPPACSAPSVAQQVELAARARPDAIAVVSGTAHLTYGALWAAVCRLAASVRARGGGPEQIVAVCCERSLELVTAILAVDAAGACLMPLDPQVPAPVLSAALEEARPIAVIADAAGEARLPEHARERLLAPNAGAEGDLLELPLSPAARAAYLLFTSGSTGRPKGVVVEKRELLAFLSDMKQHLAFDERGVWLATTSVSFDISLLELLLPLICGGKLVVSAGARDPAVLAALIDESCATFVQLTPSAWRLVIDAGWNGNARLHAISGGEALPLELARALRSRCAAVWNMYGPTEATIWASAWALPAELREISLGEPLAGRELRVLDDDLQPAAPAVPGEIFLGGAGLARGYLGRPDLTAERFVPDPHSPLPGARMYRTGDRARRLPNGSIEFKGRTDRQVKIRGHRVELGAIEAALRSLAGVRDAAVTAVRGAREEELVLNAYVVAANGARLSVAELRRALGQRISAALIPTTITQIDRLPLAPSGKVDWKALPPPQPARERAPAGESLSGEVERTLAEVFAAVLGVREIGPSEGFFELGGDSIRAVEAVAAAGERGVSISLADLFQQPTLRHLARVARAKDRAAEAGAPRFALLSPADRARLPADVEDAFPLSQLQAGMVYERVQRPQARLYELEIALHLAGAPAERWVRAIELSIARHPALRSTFNLGAFAEPLQLISRTPARSLAVLAPAEEGALDRWRADQGRALDDGVAPLVRFAIQEQADHTVRLEIYGHHALLDGWSRALLLAELFALAGDRQLEPPPDFARIWSELIERERRAAEDQATAKYWADELRGLAPRARPSAAGAMRRFDVELQPALLAELKTFAHFAGAPLKSVLLAVHLQALAELGGSADVVTGLVVDTRPELSGAAKVLGAFTKVLPFRLRVEGRRGAELVREVFQHEGRLIAHRDLGAIDLRRATRRGTPFDATFNFVHQRALAGIEEASGVRILEARFREETGIGVVANFGLAPAGDRLRVVLEGDAADEVRLRRLTEIYPRLLAGVIIAPRSQLSPAAAVPLIHRRFEEAAKKAPHRIAAVENDAAITFLELETRANRWAHQLRERGAGPEDVVAVCLPRSIEALAVLLGVWKCGAAQLALDPLHPAARQLAMLAGARARLVVTDHAGADRFTGRRLELLTLEQTPLDRSSPEPIAIEVHRSSTAYVMFTSGSTGAPKGVVVEHGSFADYIAAAKERFGLGPADRVLQFASWAFDASLEELGCAFAAGAALVLRSESALDSIPAFLEQCARAEVTVLDLPTAFWDHLVHHLDRTGAALPPAVRLVVIGGERARATTLEVWRRTVRREVELINTYGPTEATIVATWSTIDRERAGAEVPIGTAAGAALTYVLDEQLAPVERGQAGELYLGGAGLARGYIGRPDATAERFVPDPFAAEPGARMYRTGDRARVRRDGQLEFLGRADRQIKIRGQRVEPDEIEAALESHPDVRRAVVVPRLGRSGEVKLAAYVLSRERGAGADPILRRHLAERLPAALIPATIDAVDALPITASGKIDTAALPEPRRPVRSVAGAPRSLTEELVAALFEDLLEVPFAGRDDDFFALGGHSLLALQAVARIREAFGVEVSLREVFDGPSVAEIARVIARKADRAPAPERIRPPPSSSSRIAPLSLEQQSIWAESRVAGGLVHYNIPIAARLAGPLDVAVLSASLSALVERHAILRTIFPLLEGRPVQEVLPASVFELDLAEVEPGEAALQAAVDLAREELQLPFDLTAELPFRALLIRAKPEDHLLAITVHHIAADGWSIGVLLDELSRLYRSGAGGRSESMPVPPLQYADYARWQVQRLETGAYGRELAYWRKRLHGPLPRLELEGTEPSRPSFRYRACLERIERAETKVLRALAQRTASTVFMVLVAALKALLHAKSGQTDLRIGTMIANRDREETESMIGPLANTVVLRSDLSGDPPLSELLGRVRETTLGAYEHREVPFELVLRELNLGAEERASLFQVLIVHQSFAGGTLELEGLELVPGENEADPSEDEARFVLSTFELIFTVFERDGGLDLHLRYDCARLGPDAAASFLRDFVRVAELLATAPERRLSALSISEGRSS